MIYLDENFMAHPEQDTETTRVPWADGNGFFAGKCGAFIEGYRVVPGGRTWTRQDGAEFAGLMIAPMENPAALQAMQAEADGVTIAELDQAVVELTYQNVLLEFAL